MTKQLITALKLGPEPQYRVAMRAGLHPATLSRLVHGAEQVRERDERVLRVALLVGVGADEALEAVPESAGSAIQRMTGQ
jgi:hypothetical protein